jgi:outer membrane protein OmpA-like peptidoglycan-associated protein
MRRTLYWLVLFPVLASISLPALAQPSSRHDKYGKIVKLTTTEIDLEVSENDQLKVKVYVIASYAKFGPAKIGDMAKVHYYTNEKGIDIAELLTVSSETKPAPIPNPAPDPSAVSRTQHEAVPGERDASHHAAAAPQTTAMAPPPRQGNWEREVLKDELNQVLQTRDTGRGLIVNMSDELFEFNKSTLKPEAREKLAKVSHILQEIPNLNLQVEGYTDNIGSDKYNQKLSQARADAVRDYLISKGLQVNVTVPRYGESNPIADNSTASGRAQNQRVLMMVSGKEIDVEQSQPGAQPQK